VPERGGADGRDRAPKRLGPHIGKQSGVTLIEMLTAIMLAGILLSAAVPAFNDAVGNNATRMEANRTLVHIQLARSEAIKRGQNVFMCVADVEGCDPQEPSTCKCKVGVSPKRYDMGWLVFVDLDGDEDFDDDSEELLFIGLPPAEQVVMRSNNLIQFGIGLKPSGTFAEESGQGEIALCFNGESSEGVPGRMVVVKVSGRTEVKQLAPGESCMPDPPAPPGPPGPPGDDDD